MHVREVGMTRTGLEVVRKLAKQQLGEHASVRAVLGVDADEVVAPGSQVKRCNDIVSK
jgi:hypothetical protein